MRKFYLYIVTVVAFLFLAGCNNANNGNDDKKAEKHGHEGAEIDSIHRCLSVMSVYQRFGFYHSVAVRKVALPKM